MFGTHVSWRADELLKGGEDGFVGELLSASRLHDAEVNDFGHRHAVVDSHEDVRRLDVAVDDAFLMRVLNGVANLHEQIEPRADGKPGFITVIRDFHSAHQFHDEVRPSGFRRPGVKHLRNVGMVHHRQRLALGFEACNH